MQCDFRTMWFRILCFILGVQCTLKLLKKRKGDIRRELAQENQLNFIWLLDILYMKWEQEDYVISHLEGKSKEKSKIETKNVNLKALKR